MTLGDDAPVAWVHPSFRDVVIDSLMQLPVERRAFLDSCGSAGLELALSNAVSNAGGNRGERVRPLLQDDEDWEVIADRVADLLRSPAFTAIRDVLSAIEATLGVGDGPSPQRLAGTALDAMLDRWTTDEAPLAFEDLVAYYALSGRVAPLRPGPQLETAWHETCGPLESGELVTSSNVRQLFRLIEVLQDNEPVSCVCATPARYSSPCLTASSQSPRPLRWRRATCWTEWTTTPMSATTTSPTTTRSCGLGLLSLAHRQPEWPQTSPCGRNSRKEQIRSAMR